MVSLSEASSGRTLGPAASSLTCHPLEDSKMDSGLLAQVNSLVGDYLSSLDPKLAAKFKKETKAGPLPSGSPSLKEMVKHFKENPPKKRKLEMNGQANGHAPAKKAKKVSLAMIYGVFKYMYMSQCATFRNTYYIFR